MEPVGLGIKPQAPFQAIGDVMNIATKAQALQQGALEIEKNTISLGERSLPTAAKEARNTLANL